MGLDEYKQEKSGESTQVLNAKDKEDDVNESKEKLTRKLSEDYSVLTIEDDDEDDDAESTIDVGPQCSLKDQLEKDKDDEKTLEPEVKILNLAIKSPGRDDILLQIPENGKVKGNWFTLKEGSRYSLQFAFRVNNNIVSGLKYTNTVWKTGVKVDSTKEMLGTFSPQAESYKHEMPEETTPSGIFARGSS
ncbi:Rho GDP-dissociation inhibitor 1 [Bienertia sinuspersici]